MQVKSFGCKNFLGYEEANIVLPKGLVLIEGFNHDFATTSSNGAGKSGLIEPIPFALYGKTIRGMEVKHGKDSVIRDGSTGGSCAWIELSVGENKTLRVERYRKHKIHGNSVRAWLDGKDIVKGRSIPDTDKNIVGLIGIEFDLFIRTVVIHSRITESFSSLNDRYLRCLSESLLALPDFEELQKTALNKFRDMESKVEKSAGEVRVIISNINSCADHLTDLRKQEVEFEEEQKNRKGVMREEKAALLDEYRKLKNSKHKVHESAVKVGENLKSLEDEKKRIDIVLEKTKLRLTNTRFDLDTVTRELDDLIGTKREYVSLKSKKICPECGQKVSAAHIMKKINKLDMRGGSLIEKKTQAKLEYEQATHRVHKASVTASSKEDIIKKTLARKLNLISDEAHWSDNLKKLKVQIGKLSDVAALRESPYEKLIDKEVRKKKDLKKSLEEMRAKLATRRKLVPYYDFWRWGFGPHGLRSYALDGITPTLNKLANSYLGYLTDSTMTVDMSTVKKLNDGSYRDKFTVGVDNIHGAGVIAADSDGEIACIDLALCLAMSDILSHRITNAVNLLVVDQSIDSLDSVRAAKALRLLQQKLDSKWCKSFEVPRKESILVITHRDNLKDQFANRLLVEKRDGVCRVMT